MKKPTCKLCKTKPLYLRGGIPVSKFCTSCRKAKELEKKEKHKTTKSWAKKEFKRLHAKAWTLWSKHVRSIGATNGINKCYTCDEFFDVDKLQAGHFFHGKLDFDSRNIRPQCVGCNMYRSGNLAPYGVKLAQELGAEGMRQLRLDANTKTYSLEELQEVIDRYKK